MENQNKVSHTHTDTKGLQLSRVMARRNVLADIGQLTPCLRPPLFSLNTIGGHCFTFYTILHYRSCSHNRWTFSAIVSRSGSVFQQFPRHMAAALYSPSMYHEYARKERRTACQLLLPTSLAGKTNHFCLLWTSQEYFKLQLVSPTLNTRIKLTHGQNPELFLLENWARVYGRVEKFFFFL